MTPGNISEYNAAYCSGFLLLQVFYQDFCIKLRFDDDFKSGHLILLAAIEHQFSAR